MFSKILVLALSVFLVTDAKVLQIKNAGSHQLWVETSDKQDFLLKPGQVEPLKLDDDWSGKIWARSSECKTQKCDSTATVAQFEFKTNTPDKYQVSLANGFNRRVKITAVGDNQEWCRAAVCESPINHLCPQDNQIKNNNGEVVACKPQIELFKKLCPLANTGANDGNIFTCQSDEYLVLFG